MPTRSRSHLLQLLAPIILVLSVATGMTLGFAAGWLAQQAQLSGWLADLSIAITGAVAFLMAFAWLRLAQDAHSSPFERVQQAERERRSLIGGVLNRLLPPEFHWETEVLAVLSYALRFSWPLLLLLLLGGLGRDVPVPSHEIPRSLLGLVPWLAGLSAVVLLGTMIGLASFSAHAWRRLAISWGALYVGVRFLGDPVQDIATQHPSFSALAVVSALLTALFVRWSACPLKYGPHAPAANVPDDALLDANSVVQLAHQDAARLLLFGLKNQRFIPFYRLTADPRARRWYDQTRTINQEELEWRVLLHLIGSLQVTTQDQDPDDMDTDHERYHDQRYRHLTSLLIASRTGYSPVTDPETGQIILPAVPDGDALRHHHESILRPFLTANADLHQRLTHALLHTPNVSQRQLIDLLNQVIITAGLTSVMHRPLGVLASCC